MLKILCFVLFVAIFISVNGCIYVKSSQPEQGTYYESTDSAGVVKYYANVKDHFKELGYNVDDRELKEYTSAVFIASIPPVAQVFLNGKLIGRTNLELLYFKPGTHLITMRKGNAEWKETITVHSGKNPSMMTQNK
jgi:hypothetical protein